MARQKAMRSATPASAAQVVRPTPQEAVDAGRSWSPPADLLDQGRVAVFLAVDVDVPRGGLVDDAILAAAQVWACTQSCAQTGPGVPIW